MEDRKESELICSVRNCAVSVIFISCHGSHVDCASVVLLTKPLDSSIPLPLS